jgi:hypothetical protein
LFRFGPFSGSKGFFEFLRQRAITENLQRLLLQINRGLICDTQVRHRPRALW